MHSYHIDMYACIPSSLSLSYTFNNYTHEDIDICIYKYTHTYVFIYADVYTQKLIWDIYIYMTCLFI